MVKKALYLAGGGARGAYHAGILKAISHILQVKKLPFNMVSGVSVGSLNAAILASHADDFPSGVEKLETLWREISSQQIFNSSNYELGKSMLRNIRAVMKMQRAGNVLDTMPLHEFITKHIDFDAISTNILNKELEAMEVISHCYETQQTVSFYQHDLSPVEDWHYPRHISKRVSICMEHILASSALPLFFPTVKIDEFHYGDGGIGLVSPLRGAIRFNVAKILILGTRQVQKFSYWEHSDNGIGFAHVLGAMLNGLFLDNLDRDIEMVNRMNDITRLISMWRKHKSPWRPIETLYLRPSKDVAAIAQAQYQCMPALLRGFLNLLGAKNHSGDLLSFLLFEKEFTCELIELGFQDTIAVATEVDKFFSS